MPDMLVRLYALPEGRPSRLDPDIRIRRACAERGAVIPMDRGALRDRVGRRAETPSPRRRRASMSLTIGTDRGLCLP